MARDDYQNIQITLARIAELLRIGGIHDWAQAIDSLRNEIVADPAGTSAKILAMYGGMGSLNDLVLYKNGHPLAKENSELDGLRAKLHSLCRG